MTAYTRNKPGAPIRGRYAVDDTVVDSVGVTWQCIKAGSPGQFIGDLPSGEAIQRSGVGAVAGSNIVATERGAGDIHYTSLALTARALAVTDALAYAGTKIYGFPAGRILILGSLATLAFAVTSTRASTINDSAAMDWSLGTVTASSVTLASTMVDLIPKVDHTLDGAVAAYTAAISSALATNAQFDGTTAAVDAFLNVSFPTITDIDADGTLGVTGTIQLTWVNLGDY